MGDLEGRRHTVAAESEALEHVLILGSFDRVARCSLCAECEAQGDADELKGEVHGLVMDDWWIGG
jgi:hypothetical protein